jgi:hypothetical protein
MRARCSMCVAAAVAAATKEEATLKCRIELHIANH